MHYLTEIRHMCCHIMLSHMTGTVSLGPTCMSIVTPFPRRCEYCVAVASFFFIHFHAIQIVKKRRKLINLWRFALPIASINRAYKDVADNHRVSEYIQIILKLHFNAANETKTFCLSNVLYIFNFLYTCIHISIYTNLYHKFTLAMCLHYLHVFTIDNTWVSKSSSVM